MTEVSPAALRAAVLLQADLDVDDDHGTTMVVGRWRDRPMGYEEILDSPVIVTVPVRAADLRLDLRPQYPYAAAEIERGEQTDVIIGDERFDAAMLIDGAPADVVRAVFQAPELREGLLALEDLASMKLQDGAVVLTLHSTLPERLEALFDLALLAAVAIEKAHDLADDDAARGAAREGGPYRGRHEQTSIEIRRAAEIARHDDLRRRQMNRAVLSLTLALAFVVAAARLILWLIG